MDLLIENQRLPLACFLGGASPDGVALLIQARRKQSALELLAILKLLREQESPLCVEVEAALRHLSPAAFARVWSSPGAYLWTRIAFGLVRSTRQDSTTINFSEWLEATTDQLLPLLIERLWGFVLAGHLIDGRSYTLNSPLALPGSGTLPSLGLAWHASRPFRIHGVSAAGLVLTDENGTCLTLAPTTCSPGLEVTQQPRLLEGAELYLDVWSEHALASFKGVEKTRRLTRTDDLKIQAEVIRDALGIIQTLLPGMYEEMGLLLQTITPLQAIHPGLPSSSNSAMTGAIWYTATEVPTLLAEMLIHEHSHNKLFLMQDIDPFLDPAYHGTGWEDCSYYSPWRDDPRPLNGIFHGYVVFSEAALFWAHRLKQCPDECLSLRRFGMLVRQLQHARTVLEAHGAFTPPGADLMRLLGERLNQEFLPLAEALGTDQLTVMHMESNNIFEIIPGATIADAIRSHRHQWEQRHSPQSA